ncbi:ATP synthase [Scenedesmus sp. NREL 46B-D3]|nr:ATP synthase [Scenedesmus sp. NREL 46B-D3]
MLRQAAARLLRQGARSFTTSTARLEGEAAPAGVKEFTEQWNKVAPSTLNLPEFPSSFLKPEESAESAVDGERFNVNFYTPHGVVSQAKLEQVLLPGVEGYFGVKANHVPIIAQLKPGLVELHDGADITKYFVSGGFAFVHPNSVTDICVLEAATLDQFDTTAVKSALTSSQAAAATDDYEAAINRTAQELFSALDSSLEAKS